MFITSGTRINTNAETTEPQRVELILGKDLNTKEWYKALKHAKLCVKKEEVSVEQWNTIIRKMSALLVSVDHGKELILVLQLLMLAATYMVDHK